MYWEIPKLWKKQTVVLLGGGPILPSLVEGKKFNCPVIAINDAFRLYPEAEMLFFGDVKWYWWNKEDLKSFKGLKITTNIQRELNKVQGKIDLSVNDEPDIKVIKRVKKVRGLCTKPNTVYFNSSSGAAAINLVFHLGAKKVILVGYDMRVIDNKRNWRDHPNVVPGVVPKGFDHFIKPFDRIAKDAKRLKLEILNATPKSGLTHFPFVSLESLCELWTSTRPSNTCLMRERALPGMEMVKSSCA